MRMFFSPKAVINPESIQERKHTPIRALYSTMLFRCILLLLLIIPVFAGADSGFTIHGKNYVLPSEIIFDYTGEKPVDAFFYGSESLGTLRIEGGITKVTEYNGYPAYGANGSVSVSYVYAGNYRDTKPEE